MNDPQKIWQEQPEGGIKVSLNEVRRRARKLELQGRVSALAGIIIGLSLSVGFGLMFARAQGWSSPRIGSGLLSVWALYGAWSLYRWVWPRKIAADSTWSASLTFYVSELEKKRDYTQHAWRRGGLTWCMAGGAMIVIPLLMQAWPSAVPFLLLLSVWFVAFFLSKKRTQQKLQREIDELNALRTSN